MKVDIGGFLASLAVLAACLTGCTVETTSSGLGASSSSATTGSSTGTAGSSSSATTSSSTGAGGAGGGDVDASTGTGGAPDDASGDVSTADGGACFPDDANAGDAGVSPCSSLPYATVQCGDAMDQPPLGQFICEDLEGDLKIAAFQELYDCLKAIPGADGGADACSTAHDDAASACSKQLFSRTTCDVPPITVDGGAFGCAQIVASCPGDGGTDGISLSDCQRFLSPFNDKAREFIVSCYFDPTMPAGTGCADKFENVCVFPEP
jgi:hypothetical protein